MAREVSLRLFSLSRPDVRMCLLHHTYGVLVLFFLLLGGGGGVFKKTPHPCLSYPCFGFAVHVHGYKVSHLVRLRHPNIVTFFGICVDSAEKSINVILERYPSSLEEALAKGEWGTTNSDVLHRIARSGFIRACARQRTAPLVIIKCVMF